MIFSISPVVILDDWANYPRIKYYDSQTELLF
jgi:hypothetical protein